MTRLAGAIWTAIGTGLGALLFYAATAATGLGLPDSAIAIREMLDGTVSSHVCSHNLNVLTGHLFLRWFGGDPVRAANLLMAVHGALAIALFCFALRLLDVRAWVAAGASAVLAVSHSMWWHSTQVENYALSAIFLCGVLGLVVASTRPSVDPLPPRRVAPLFLLAGLALFNHLQNGALLLAAGAALFASGRMNRRGWLVAACAYAIGALPWLTILLRDLLHSDDVASTLKLAVHGGFGGQMFRYDLDAFRRFGEWLVLQFPSPFLIAIPAGLIWLWFDRARRPLAVFVSVFLAVNLAFFLGYDVWDQFAFYLASFIVLALCGALALERLASRGLLMRVTVGAALLIAIVAPPFAYPLIAEQAKWPGTSWGRRFAATHALYAGRYDLVGLYLNPSHRDRGSVERYLRALLFLPERAMLIDDMSIYYQYDLLRALENVRADVDLRLLTPPGHPGWGESPDALARATAAHRGRIFLTTTNGPAATLINRLRWERFHIEPFDLGPGMACYEAVPLVLP